VPTAAALNRDPLARFRQREPRGQVAFNGQVFSCDGHGAGLEVLIVFVYVTAMGDWAGLIELLTAAFLAAQALLLWWAAGTQKNLLSLCQIDWRP
jgi:hypothetical protein